MASAVEERNLLAARVRHWLNRNSRSGSKRNIMAHYDLGNDFYRLWLDPGMSYSSALYRAVDGGDLETAQRAKYRRILRRLQADPGQSVLEIGCGWGGFAEIAVGDGLQVTGLTLSPAQLEWAQKRVPEADLRLQDYRDISEQFDHIVSIEMFEAVGERWWPKYFQTIARALKPGGRAVVQSITIRDDLFGDYRKGTDFIQQYVFPGGMLPSRPAFRAAAARQGLAVRGEYAFGADYARTLGEWRRAFEANWPQIAALGFDETACRPSLLHGDLWGGNWGVLSGSREPAIFDPAVYYGDRETDIAMTRLFGGFGPRFYAAYQATWPLDQAAGTRCTLYNLYHVLNHFNLFGGGYGRQAEGMIDRLLAELGV